MAPLSAETPASKPASQDELIQALLARVGQLEKRVADLENVSQKRYGPAPAVYTVASASVPAAAESGGKPNMDHHGTTQAMPPSAASAEPVYPSLKIAGFSDFNFSATD